jgi:hypothetical protein
MKEQDFELNFEPIYGKTNVIEFIFHFAKFLIYSLLTLKKKRGVN